jgi:mRNA interferase MazF
MKPGDVLLATMNQADGRVKKRPVIFLATMAPFNDLLVCGVSSQLRNEEKDFDELILPEDADFSSSRLQFASLIRLGFLAVYPASRIVGTLGYISDKRLKRLLLRLGTYFTSLANQLP